MQLATRASSLRQKKGERVDANSGAGENHFMKIADTKFLGQVLAVVIGLGVSGLAQAQLKRCDLKSGNHTPCVYCAMGEEPIKGNCAEKVRMNTLAGCSLGEVAYQCMAYVPPQGMEPASPPEGERTPQSVKSKKTRH
jgi:hypothetical protein